MSSINQVTIRLKINRNQEINILLYDIFCSKKLEEVAKHMKRLSEELEYNKKQTDLLLYKVLPVTIADAIRRGEKIDACKSIKINIQ